MDVSDKWIGSEILEEFIRSDLPGFERVNIKVLDGFVTLEGRVPTYAARNRYTDAVLKIEGVLSLMNQLRVHPSALGKIQTGTRRQSGVPTGNQGSYEIDK